MDAVAPTPLNAREAADLLAGTPFAVALNRGALALAAGQPARAIFATSSALALAGVRDLYGLDSVLFGAESPGARRLRRLADEMPLGAPRLEQLRFFANRLPLQLGLVVGRLRGPQGMVLALASPQSLQGALAETAEAAPSADSGFVTPPLDGHVRFLWSLDAEGRFGDTDPTLTQRLGSCAPRSGETLEALKDRTGFDAEGALAAALASERSFSALRLEWPEPGERRARVVALSGVAVRDRAGRPSGVKGFGFFTGEAVALGPAPVRRPLVPPPSEAPVSPVEAPPAAAVAELEVAPLIPEPAFEPPDAPAAEVAPAPVAEIVHLRASAAPSPNVIPIRPGAFNALIGSEESDGGRGDVVELSTQERDAFREIARALGVRLRAPRSSDEPPEDREPLKPQPLPQETPAPATPANDERSDAARLVDLLPIGAMVLRGGEALYLNRTLLELLGYPSTEAFRAADGVAKTFRGRDAEALAGAGGMPLVTAEEELLTVDAHVRPIHWEGAPASLISIRRSHESEHRDQVRALELDIRAEADKARDAAAMLELAADGVLRLDGSGRVLSMNRAAERLFGCDQKEAAGESFLAFVHPEQRKDASAGFDRLAGGEPADAVVFETQALAQNERAFPARFTLRPLRLGESREFGLVVDDLTAQNAHERRLAAEREAAEQASARKTDFLASVSHQIRTPLHAILGFAEVMIEERFGPVGNERYKEYLKDIHTSGQHMMSLANDLLDLAKIEAGRMELQFAPLDANRIIRECVTLMQPQAARERVIVRLSLSDKLPNVMADERSLRQILLNLISNAVKYNEPGGQVIISTALDESGQAIIRVRDTGMGMSESEVALAMEPFRRVSGRRDQGTGLGLPLTRALAVANHAAFSIKSGKEQGTLVEVAFPLVKAAQ